MDKELTLEQFISRFDTEEACAEYLFQVKWPHGFICPRCDHHHFYLIATRRLPLYECADCRHQTSLIVGTVMENSRTPLHKWFITFFLLSRASSISALHLSKKIQVTYKTAWLILYKIRQAMSEADASILLSGLVEVNDACYGRPSNSTSDRHPQEHPLLIGASMSRTEPTYIKMKLLPDAHLQGKYVLRGGKEAFTEQHVERGTSDITFITERFKPRKLKNLFPLFAQANQWINETFHGLGPSHLQAYLNEFCYRINLNLQNVPIFESLIQLCSAIRVHSYMDLFD
jgi:transposase-like protein